VNQWGITRYDPEMLPAFYKAFAAAAERSPVAGNGSILDSRRHHTRVISPTVIAH